MAAEIPKNDLEKGFAEAWARYIKNPIPTWGPNAAKTFFEAGMRYQQTLQEKAPPAGLTPTPNPTTPPTPAGQSDAAAERSAH